MTKKSAMGRGEREVTKPSWLDEMRNYYQETGTYRAEDVQRVLGEPGDCFEGKPSKDMRFNFLPDK